MENPGPLLTDAIDGTPCSERAKSGGGSGVTGREEQEAERSSGAPQL